MASAAATAPAPAAGSATAESEWPKGRRLAVILIHLTIALLGTASTAKGVFFPSLVAAFHLSHAAGAALISVSGLVGAVVACGAGWLMVRRVPADWVVVTVPLLSAAGYLIASFANGYGQLLVGYILLGGTAVNLVAIAFLLTGWFSTRRGFALALVYAGTTTGGVLLNPLLSTIVEGWGWRAGYQFLAATLLVLPLLLHVVLKGQGKLREIAPEAHDHPAGTGLTIPLALASRSFWLIVFVSAIFGANTGTYFVHFIALLESTGYTASQASWTMSQLFLLAAVAKLVFGYVGDRLDIRVALAIALLMSAAGWLLLDAFESSQAALYGFTLIFGLSYSGPLVLIPLLIARVFGKRSFALIDAGISLIGLGIGGGLGPVLAGRVYDVSGSYQPLYLYLTFSLLAAAGAVLLVRRQEYDATHQLAPPRRQLALARSVAR
jgi:predicted MFS family arabinose efflux permease